MPKNSSAIALFGVASEKMLGLMTEWREAYLTENMPAGKAVTKSRCTSTADEDAPDSWRRGHGAAARLLSICSHGSGGSVQSCSSGGPNPTDFYESVDAATYPELPGAILHLLACEALKDLAGELSAPGLADAVIGYEQVFAAEVGEIDIETATVLPAPLVPVVECDCRVLIALAEGKTVAEAVQSAKDWAAAQARSFRLPIFGAMLPAVMELLVASAWRRANIEHNAHSLGFRGDGNATM